MTPSSETPPSHDDLPERVGPYRITAELGRGGMGVVYRADDTRTGQTVALKVLPTHLLADAEARAHLAREARALGALDHENVCAFLDTGEAADGALYLAMAFHEGETLEARLARGPLPVPEAVEVARQVARGLAAAHAQGVVHRDLKPSNVYLGADGVARLLDFGIARVAGATRTATGATARTLAYAAPEQTRGESEAASDVWSLGVVLYEMLAGRRPFRGRYEAALVYAILHGSPEPLRKARPEVPVAVEAVVMRCLEKRAEDRFADAAALERALGAALAGERPGRSGRVRRRVALSGSLLSVAAVVGVLAWPSVREVLYPLPDHRQIAVLPFEAPGADSTGLLFAEGLAETLSGELSGFEGVNEDLWVIPYGTVRERQIEQPGDAWRSLRATLVVMGSVYRTTEGVRLPLQLVETRTGRQLRSVTVEAGADELGELPIRATRALGAMLDAVLREGAERTAPPTTVSAAYEAYLLGMGYLGRSPDVTAAQTAAAREQFAEAVRLDPNFALAIAQLASTSYSLAEKTGEAPWAVPADSLIDRAFALAPDSPLVLSIYSIFQQRRGQAEAAIQSLERAIALDPTYMPAYSNLAIQLVEVYREEEAEALLRTAIQRRPTDGRPYFWLANLLGGDRPEEAKDVALEGLRWDPENYMMYMLLGGIAERLGEDGVSYYENAATLRPSPFLYTILGRRAYVAGNPVAGLDYFRRALALDTASIGGYMHYAWALWRLPSERPNSVAAFGECARRYARLFRPDGAIDRVDYTDDYEAAVELAQCYAGSGDFGQARAVLTELQPATLLRDRAATRELTVARRSEPRYHAGEMAKVYVLLGDTVRTEPVELLHYAVELSELRGNWLARWYMHFPEYQPLIRHPRWAELERERRRP